jgi:3-oxoacyl-[acyl-carrier protein] reductase
MSIERILLTGASSDLAGALIERLVRWAPCPEIMAHHHGSPDRIQRLQELHGALIQEFQADLTFSEETERLVETVRQRWGYPQGIVHFPALPLRLERFPRWDQKRFLADLSLQVFSLGQILRAFLPDMARSGQRCKVVFLLSSVVHGIPPKFMSMYTVAKYAQLGLMRAAAAEYAGTGVSVNALSPSMVETRFLSGIAGKAVELSAARMPHGRNLKPGEVADALEFLLSSGSDGLHGVDMPLTDGSVI